VQPIPCWRAALLSYPLNLVLPHRIDEHVLLAVAVNPKWDNDLPSPGTREYGLHVKTADRVLGVHGLVIRHCWVAT
jgi:hypothetical protein